MGPPEDGSVATASARAYTDSMTADESGAVYKIGFTGTQAGLTEKQSVTIEALLKNLRRPGRMGFVFGLCVGADDQVAMIAGNLGYVLIARPGESIAKRGRITPHFIYPPDGNLARNAAIVGDSDILVAAPRQPIEILRSGTWATVRAARKARIPICVVLPNGRLSYESPA